MFYLRLQGVGVDHSEPKPFLATTSVNALYDWAGALLPPVCSRLLLKCCQWAGLMTTLASSNRAVSC